MARTTPERADLAPFIGREALLHTAASALRETRCLSLTGIGGVGKSRLARELVSRHDESTLICHVDLSSLADREREVTEQDVVAVVARAMRIPLSSTATPTEVVCRSLAQQKTLFLLDHAEHVAGFVERVVETLLRAAETVRIVLTSRIAVGVPGRTVPVPPMPVPVTAAVDDLADSDAVQLFAAHARNADPGFRLDDELPAVVDACRAVDGIPLGVVLVAGWLHVLSASEAARLLARDRDVLLSVGETPLHAVLEWTWAQVTETERQLWQRLVPFQRRITVDAVRSVCVGDSSEDMSPEQAMQALHGLVHKSVVTKSADGLVLLDTVREYGLRRTTTDHDVERRHRDYYAAQLATAAVEHRGTDEASWMRALAADLPNITAALRYTLKRGEHELLVTMMRDWIRTSVGEWGGHLREVDSWAQHVLTEAAGTVSSTAFRELAAWASWCSLLRGDLHTASQTLVLARRDADESSAAVLFAAGSHALLATADIPAAVELLQQARDQFHVENQWSDTWLAELLLAMAVVAHDEAESNAVEVTRHFVNYTRESHGCWALAWAEWIHALACFDQGQLDAAETTVIAALERHRDAGDRDWGAVWGILLRAWIAAARGRNTLAARLMGAAERRQEMTGVMPSGLRIYLLRHKAAYALLQQRFGHRRCNEERTAGTAMRWHAVLTLALDDDAEQQPRQLLTAREYEIADMLARDPDMTYARAARTLHIAERTVENHMANAAAKIRDTGAVNRDDTSQWRNNRLTCDEYIRGFEG